ncbi:MAG: TetR/AcrR family transcriptional regulator [Dysosmobacter sp.]|nr:TetR/AcrR family transcriptional regulator [Dysosmobacter sp.]
MPSETFFRLPEEKRSRFLDAAWEEFVRVRFADVSINQIIKKAGIPRGSFYQYFIDKEDLFLYLLDGVRAHVRDLYRAALVQAEGDVFQAQLACFDGLTSLQDLEREPVLGRCVLFLKNNQGVDIQKLVPGQPGRMLLDGLWDLLDLTAFRRKDREYIYNVFALLMAALGSAFMDALCHLEERDACRAALALRLEIIRDGCLAP